MKLVVFFAIVGLAYAAHGHEHATELPTWANETKYGRYQDAWKSLNQSDATVYWLVKANFNNDNASWGQSFRCLNVRETNISQANHTVVSVFRFQNASSNGSEVYTVNETVKAISEYNYNNSNAIQYTLNDGRKLNDTLIFSNDQCDVFHVPYLNDGNGCELWVKHEYRDNVPPCCLFIYTFFCTKNVTSYDIYQKNCTDNK
uniref:Lipocal-1 1 n=1 Tax=Amblyomma americanum TaxID=6943 RepID=A0A0C9S564_AMBAM